MYIFEDLVSITIISVLLDYDESTKETENTVDPTIIKTLCQQMEALNKLLIKVDDDIEAVDGLTDDEIDEILLSIIGEEEDGDLGDEGVEGQGAAEEGGGEGGL